MNCQIIKAHPTQASKIFEIEKENFLDFWSLKGVEDEISSGNGLVCVCENEIIGYLFFDRYEMDYYIKKICVMQKYRKLNIAKNLISNMIKTESACITLEVRQSNLNAINFYEHIGFCLIGTRKNMYSNPTEDAKIYKKTI